MRISSRKIFALSFCSTAVALLLMPLANLGLHPEVLNGAYGLAVRPNIVVIMVDDLDQRSLDILLDEGLMPNLKKHIISKGISFSESFATYPVCCPSRATFLTGQYPHNHNVMHNKPPIGGVTKLEDSSTLATWLQNSGYHTAFVGKYLNRYGVDTAATYIPPGWNDWQATVGSSTYRMYSYTVNDNGILVKYGSTAKDYQTDVLAILAAESINETEPIESKPFFLYVNPLAPHEDDKTAICELNYEFIKSIRPAPRHIGTTAGIAFPKSPSFNEADVSDKPWYLRYPTLNNTQIACLDELFHGRLESMRAVDDLIGKVVATLIANKELWKTVIVFTSDNGFLLGEHRLHGKKVVYEESIRVPLYMRIPGVVPSTIDRLVINNDLAPTLLELASAHADIQIDGRSLVPLINNPGITWRNGFLIEDNTYSGIRTENYVYAFNYTGAKEIYDLNTDPYQLQNVRSASPWKSKLAALEQWRAELIACQGAACRIAENKSAP